MAGQLEGFPNGMMTRVGRHQAHPTGVAAPTGCSDFPPLPRPTPGVMLRTVDLAQLKRAAVISIDRCICPCGMHLPCYIFPLRLCRASLEPVTFIMGSRVRVPPRSPMETNTYSISGF